MDNYDVYLDSGVNVKVPKGTDPETTEGLAALKDAAVRAFREMLDGMFDIPWDRCPDDEELVT